ncbi:sugar O-acetyltransferase [Vibrio sp. LaRot3]|uniref:sugar O-acetyltransferase n=1 Tax=Vibrio sp. LaRot3 TaxID=2998829 RepID=UPI0022CDF7D0|nr:sugar O-acetyltransferase [Vibrio sp. LaRot3]MDA0147403.1 sugar O-acetyltransferase [Vibrio sp. LaRot3]
MSVQHKIHSQQIYCCADSALIEEQKACMERLYDYNQSRPSETEKRGQLLHDILASAGKDCYVEPPLRANWGRHTSVGDYFYANFNLTLVDDTYITIGNYVMIGPNVTLSTAGHPIDPDTRKRAAQFNIPIVIQDNVWIGANVVVLPGVTIGENSVIGAGSIVTKDVPANVVAVGNPCKVLREIGERDKQFYYRDKRFDPESLINQTES